jgi:hypothetical protein
MVPGSAAVRTCCLLDGMTRPSPRETSSTRAIIAQARKMTKPTALATMIRREPYICSRRSPRGLPAMGAVLTAKDTSDDVMPTPPDRGANEGSRLRAIG